MRRTVSFYKTKLCDQKYASSKGLTSKEFMLNVIEGTCWKYLFVDATTTTCIDAEEDLIESMSIKS